MLVTYVKLFLLATINYYYYYIIIILTEYILHHKFIVCTYRIKPVPYDVLTNKNSLPLTHRKYPLLIVVLTEYIFCLWLTHR